MNHGSIDDHLHTDLYRYSGRNHWVAGAAEEVAKEGNLSLPSELGCVASLGRSVDVSGDCLAGQRVITVFEAEVRASERTNCTTCDAEQDEASGVILALSSEVAMVQNHFSFASLWTYHAQIDDCHSVEVCASRDECCGHDLDQNSFFFHQGRHHGLLYDHGYHGTSRL